MTQSIFSFLLFKKYQNIKYFFWLSKQWNNVFFSTCSTRTIRNKGTHNNHLYYVCMNYCTMFNGVCSSLTIYMHILSVIPHLCSFFQNLKNVTVRRFGRNRSFRHVVNRHNVWIRSDVGVLLNIITCSRGDYTIELLNLHRWNAGMSDKNQNWLFTIHFTTLSSISLCNARMSRYRHPSSFSFRIKCPCSHWNSWFYPFQIVHNLRISIRQSNALVSGYLVFIFTLNHAYYREHPISTSFSLSLGVLNDKTSL